MPLFLLANWKWIASASVAAILSFYATHLWYDAKISRMETAQAEAVLDGTRATLAMFTADAARVHEAAEGFTAKQADLDSRFASISKDFANAIKARPLPVDCKPDTDRLRSLQAAVDAANTATGRSAVPAVPANP